MKALNHSERYQGRETRDDEVVMIKRELAEQDNLIGLLKTEVGSYKK